MTRRAYEIKPVVINDTKIDYEFKSYKMVWLMEDDKFYIGVITAFKDRRL